MENKESLLIIFIKNPEKGHVKTRLARTLGEEKALSIYKRLIHYTRSVASGADADKQVWYSRFISGDDEWDREGYSKRLQPGGNLGTRMKEAFRQAFRDGYRKVVIIGSDCAELTVELLNSAYEKLDDHNVVVGPSEDGGYYLLGMDQFYGEIFEGISWSTPQVLPETISTARNLDLEIGLLPERNDVDTERDWLKVKDRL